MSKQPVMDRVLPQSDFKLYSLFPYQDNEIVGIITRKEIAALEPEFTPFPKRYEIEFLHMRWGWV